MHLGPGVLVSPTLRLARKLSQGGMGAVWVADHLTLRTEVAVKFVSPEVAAVPGGLERFSREAAAAARMKHPHVVQIFDHGTSHQGAPYIAMELLEGESLADRLARTATLGLDEAVLVIGQVCKALSKAHAIGLVHRDIKPDNIFLIDLEGEPFVKMLDFGVAKHVAADQRRVTSTGALVGTPRYMSPEQALSARDVDLQADLWSVAVVAYECLTGAAPFDGDTVGAVFVSIASGLFERPSRRAPGLPSDLDDWFERAFARDAHTRFASARELADSFATACEARTAAFPSRAPRAPVPARKSSAPPRPARVERAPGPALAPAPRLPRPESFAPAVVAPTLPTTSLPSPVSGTDSRTEAPTLTTATVTWSSARARGLLIAVAAGGFAATLLVAVAIGSKSFSGDATSSAEPPGAGSARVDASLERPLSTSPGWEDAKPDESVLSVDAFPPIVIEAGPPDAGDATKAKDAAKPPRPPDVVVPPPPPPPPKEPRTTPPPKPTVPPDCCDPWCIKRPPCN